MKKILLPLPTEGFDPTEVAIPWKVPAEVGHDVQFATWSSGPSPNFRDSPEKLKHGFALLDRNYLSARWPGDAYNFANAFDRMLQL